MKFVEETKPAISLLKEVFSYDGLNLIWKNRPESHFATSRGAVVFNAKYAGKVAGTVLRPKCVYKITQFKILDQTYNILVHSIIWALHNNRWQEGEIDHIDGNGFNNSIENLREVSRKENMMNKAKYKSNSSGVVGVNWYKKYSCWVAKGTKDRIKVHLGYYDGLSDAISARQQWEIENNFHKNHGR